ncbi:MAG: hypothetical protein DSY92_08070 [Planctomycetota bacterium]|nr:MAG: hypothetical protein DSY92_08070 [Planctomycetota bacterium]
MVGIWILIEAAQDVAHLMAELVGHLGPAPALHCKTNADGTIGISPVKNDRPTGRVDTDQGKLWRASRLPQRLGRRNEDRIHIGTGGAPPPLFGNFDAQVSCKTRCCPPEQRQENDSICHRE